MGPPDQRADDVRVYVDMVGDLFHAGHVELLRAARAYGDRLVVGVLSDETAAAYKRRPVMTLAERVAVIESCRFVDEVVADAPGTLSEAFLDEHRIAVVVHGDDLSPDGAELVYGPAVAAGSLRHRPAHQRAVDHRGHPARARPDRPLTTVAAALPRKRRRAVPRSG